MTDRSTSQPLRPVILGLLVFVACVLSCLLGFAKARAAENFPFQVLFGVGLACSGLMAVLSVVAVIKVHQARRSHR